MKRRTSASLLLALAAASFLTACHDQTSPTEPAAPSAQPKPVAADAQVGPDRYIVVFTPQVADVAGEARRQVAQHRGRLHFIYQHALRGYAATLPPAAVTALRANPAVRDIQPVSEVRADDTQSPTPSWGLDRIDQRDLPLSNSFTYMRMGAGVRVYILDSGIRTTHQDFAGRAISGVNFVPDGRGTDDCGGHGTYVAGIVAGTKYGVAKLATLVAVRVLDCSGHGTTDWIIAGVDWVTAHAQKPAVANMSLSAYAFGFLNEAVTNSIATGITYVISAGNENYGGCTGEPASAPAALTIAATTQLDARASFSNFGSCVDLFAPGESITSDFNSSDQAVRTANGTSASAPHVAGATALYLEQYPLATPAQVANALKNKASVGKISNPGAGTPNLLLYMGFLSPGDLWVTRAPLLTPRSMFAMGVFGDLLYVAGGRSNGTSLRSVLAYSATANAWSSRAQMPSPRWGGDGAGVINGVLYVPGGFSVSGQTPTRTLYAYKLSTNTWSTKAALPIPSGCGASAVIGGQLYVLTGCVVPDGYTGRLHRYNPSTNSWTARASPPSAHGYPAIGVIGGKLYVAGGASPGAMPTRTVHVYNPATNTWSTKAPLPAALFGAAGGVIDGRLYVVGGGTDGGSVEVASTYVYDPQTNAWTSKHPMPTARWLLGAGVIAKRLYAVGGRRDETDLTKVERYKP